jgi:uncharacterized protein YjiS (DUF1127 family)
MTPFILITTGEPPKSLAPAAPAPSRANLWAERLGAWLDRLMEADVQRLDDRMLKDIGLRREALGYDPGLRHRTGLGF